MFGLTTMAKVDEAVGARKLAFDLLREERAEVKRLTDIIVKMRMDGFNLRPQDTEEAWEGGAYVMDDVEREQLSREPLRGRPLAEVFAEEDLALAGEVEAQIAADFRRIFEQED